LTSGACVSPDLYAPFVPFTIEPGATTDLDPCECCGGRTRVVRGFVHSHEGARAVYVVRWAPGRPQHGAAVALSIGRWGGASASERACFAFDHRVDDRPGFVIVDAGTSPFAAHEQLLGRMMTRAEALASHQKQEAFEILDAIGEQDGRLSGWWLDARAH
jgi:hypothetical protein